MKLPDTKQNSQKGQILIIFLLVLVVGLAIALSIASRTVTDVRQSTTSDESNRAYFAAEAGVENALKKIEDTTINSSNVDTVGLTGADLNLTSTNRSSADVTVKNLDVPDNVLFEYPALLNKDDVAQVNLMANFNDIATAGKNDSSTGFNGIQRSDTLDIYWEESTSSKQSAIEVSIITCDGPCSNSSTFKMYKMVYDPDAAAHGNNFCTGAAISAGGTQTTNLGKSYSFIHKVSLKLDSNSLCPGNDILGPGQEPVLARIRILYDGSVRLAVGNTLNRLPNQGYQVESLGKTTSGVARKLVVNRLFPALPAVFDYVLYNGSTSNPLSKP